jgi:hypothetical protein
LSFLRVSRRRPLYITWLFFPTSTNSSFASYSHKQGSYIPFASFFPWLWGWLGLSLLAVFVESASRGTPTCNSMQQPTPNHCLLGTARRRGSTESSTFFGVSFGRWGGRRGSNPLEHSFKGVVEIIMDGSQVGMCFDIFLLFILRPGGAEIENTKWRWIFMRILISALFFVTDSQKAFPLNWGLGPGIDPAERGKQVVRTKNRPQDPSTPWPT